MADFPLVVDVAKFQNDSLAFFQDLKNKGVQAIIVQLTAGSKGHPYSVNPKRENQVNNARAAGLRVHAYHYSYSNGHDDTLSEVINFLEQYKALGFDPNNDFAFIDEEDKTNANPATDDINTWTDAVYMSGVENVGVYSMASWFKSGRINQVALHSDNLWIANYGVSSPGVDKVNFWQFTDKFYGVDCSYDFFGKLTQPVSQTGSVIIHYHDINGQGIKEDTHISDTADVERDVPVPDIPGYNYDHPDIYYPDGSVSHDSKYKLFANKTFDIYLTYIPYDYNAPMPQPNEPLVPFMQLDNLRTPGVYPFSNLDWGKVLNSPTNESGSYGKMTVDNISDTTYQLIEYSDGRIARRTEAGAPKQYGPWFWIAQNKI